MKDDLDRDKALGTVPRGLKRPLDVVGLFCCKLSVSVSEPARLTTVPDSSTLQDLMQPERGESYDNPDGIGETDCYCGKDPVNGLQY
jgi:hypothetical protein